MSSNSKKFSRIMLAVVLIVFAVVFALPTSVSAVNTEKKADIFCNEKLYLENRELCDRIAEGIDQVQDYIYVGDIKFDVKRLPFIIKTVIRMHPELFYINTKQFALGSDEKGNIAVICPFYLGEKSEIEAQRENFDKRVNEILSLVDEGMSEFEKALVVHDEIVLNCEYSNDEDNMKYITAYGALVNEKANCQGYSAAYSHIMSLLGIETEVVESSSLFHVWNKIKIDGLWYNADVTWDDPLYDKQGHVSHKYFLVSNDAIVGIDSGTNKDYGFDYESKKCTSTKYDKSEFHKIDTRFCFVDDNCYVIDNNYGSTCQKCLIKFDPVTGKYDIEKKFDVKWMSGTTDTSYWKNTFLSLEVHDDLLYLNTANKVYTYDVVDKKLDEFVPEVNISAQNKAFYGLIIKGCDVFVATADKPNEQQVLTNIGQCVKRNIEVGILRHVWTENRIKLYILYGDVDLDKKIKIIDATEIQKYSVDIVNFEDIQLISGDINGDGLINVIDSTLIQKYLADM